MSAISPACSTPVIRIRGLAKTFILHHQQGAVLRVLQDIDLDLAAGECLVLHGASGAGKSTLLRTIYANYRSQCGSLEIVHRGRWLDIGRAGTRELLDVRRETMGYVSQFLRVIPRVRALDIVAEPLLADGMPGELARDAAAGLLARLNVPEKLWTLPPATFSGGEQQRINIARGFIREFPILLLDEPTAALDAVNRSVVADLIQEACRRGTAIIGIFHDEEIRARVATRLFRLQAQMAA